MPSETPSYHGLTDDEKRQKIRDAQRDVERDTDKERRELRRKDLARFVKEETRRGLYGTIIIPDDHSDHED